MKNEFLQPAATIAATLLSRLAQKKDVSAQEVTSAFLLAYEALEDAEDQVGRGHYRSKPRQAQ